MWLCAECRGQVRRFRPARHYIARWLSTQSQPLASLPQQESEPLSVRQPDDRALNALVQLVRHRERTQREDIVPRKEERKKKEEEAPPSDVADSTKQIDCDLAALALHTHDLQQAQRAFGGTSAANSDVYTSLLPAQTEGIALTEEQEKIARFAVESGESIFFTGKAGTGKSVLLRDIIRRLKMRELAAGRDPHARIMVTASTGLAAVGILGRTIHAVAGWGHRFGQSQNDQKHVHGLTKRWRAIQTLIIDEISMISSDTFERLDKMCRKIRNVQAPFGGIQLIVTGDFMQLPPILSEAEIRARIEKDHEWTQAMLEEDRKQRRRLTRKQLLDPHFVPDFSSSQQVGHVFNDPGWTDPSMAARIRRYLPRIEEYKRKKADVQELFCFESALWPKAIQHAFELSTVFRQAKDPRLKALLDEVRTGDISDASDALLQSLSRPIAPPNDDSTVHTEPTLLYSRVAQVSAANLARMQSLSGETYAYRAFDHTPSGTVPTTLSLDQTDRAISFSMPMMIWLKRGAQVMLTKNIDPKQGLVNGAVGIVTAFRPLETLASTGLLFPVVAFVINGHRLEKMILPCEEKQVEDDMATIPESAQYISRLQLPLTLAWAYSIHKSQGQTLDKVVIDLSGVFEKGQAYVALSRATSLDRLQVFGYQRSLIQCHPRVLQFYDSLKKI